MRLTDFGRATAFAKSGKRVKPFLMPEMFEALLALIREPYSTMVFLAVFTGLRISELIGLRWRNVNQDSITIEERYCRGDCVSVGGEGSAHAG